MAGFNLHAAKRHCAQQHAATPLKCFSLAPHLGWSSTRHAMQRCHVAAAPQQHQPPPAAAAASSRQRLSVVCMAHPRRVAKVSSQIQREISEMFVSDPVIQAAICPERRVGDDTLSAVASITETYVSNDLQVVKVYVSVYSDERGKRRAIDNLQRLAPYVRRQIGSRVRLRLTPEIRFLYDDSIEEAELVAKVIGKEDVARYQQEIEQEASDRLAARRGGAAALAAGGAAAAVAAGTAARAAAGAGDDDEEEGFFEGVGQAAGKHQQRQGGGEEEEGFFDQAVGDEAEGEAEGEAYDEDEDWEEDEEEAQAFPDPFGDLFQGGGDELVTLRDERQTGRARTQGRQGRQWQEERK